ncbi:uncharacterized protein BX663DRAFT_492824 [Cokeromyces recurvatus]|uniref:uncharacterized protein n=1 Tax=Cokeromyces recurvatus TaxID=90255 RepID=UPI002221288C|nr:uncharacterized protein BX663DRAFT_492824 [Cokeromyces recurvatus]KAI7908053.1 hypothetical protein BX663DRAFT_492824 [Cokeromyces recurvatus]
MDTRYNQLILISKRVEKANEQLNEIINKLGWTREELQQWHNEHKKLLICPFDKRHVVPENSMKKHYKHCLLKSRGIYIKKNSNERKREKKYSTLFFYKNAPSVISFVDDGNEEEESISLASTQKCQIYDELIQRSNQLRQQHKKKSL